MNNPQNSNPIGKTLQSGGAWLGNVGTQLGVNYLTMLMQEGFNKKAENRANSEWFNRFNAQNRYNSPENQAKLIAKAGGNPLSLFSNGYSPNPANPSNPSFAIPTSQGVNFAAANESALIQSQVNLNDAQAEKLRSDIDVNTSDISLNKAYEEFTKQQTLSESQLTRLRSIEADIQEATKGTQISTYVASLEKMLSEVKNIDQNSEYYRQLSFQVELSRAVEQFKLDNILPSELANIQADTSLKVANTALSQQESQRLRDLTAKDKHELYLEYQKVAHEYPYLTYQNNLSEKEFDSIISDFVSYSIKSDNFSDSFREREVSAQENSANASSINAANNAGQTLGFAFAIALSIFGGGRFKKIGEKMIKNATQRTIVK